MLNLISSALAAMAAAACCLVTTAGAADPVGRKIVLIAGDLDGHPAGTHEYEKSVLLLKHCLDTAPGVPQLRTQVHFHGWPGDPATLDDADCIVMISAGSDRSEADHPFYVGDRMDVLDRQMQRGCGLVAIHWSTFAPLRAKARILRWLGGFFDYESGSGGNRWHSAITTADWDVSPATASHPILYGVPEAFSLREEFYHRLRFLPGDGRLVPLWRIGTDAGESGLDNVTAWCVEREDGGRGFGTTGGHFYANWEVAGFRRTILNGIVWAAGLAVPEGGVDASLLDVAETRGVPGPRPHRALVLTGHHHPAHDWEKVTAVLREVLHQEGTIAVDVTRDPEMLARADLSAYDVLIQNYNNWDRPGWSVEAREAFRRYVDGGGGLVILHFANGAFHRTTPAGIRSHWDDYAGGICRRVWDHGTSGHDPFGRFTARFTDVDHPIVAGLEGQTFETVDELYFNQVGDLPIQPLVTARSVVTNQDEPLAFAYDCGDGRVFQCLLGHAPESVGAPGTAELLRRGTLWAAGAALGKADPARLRGPAVGGPAPASGERFVDGRFGMALNASAGGVVVPGRSEFRTLPLTIECWAKLRSKSGFNILAACDPKGSSEHWELYSYAGTGEFSLYLPGRGGEFRSGVDICDGRWHHLAATIAEDSVRLFVDGREVLSRPPAPLGGRRVAGGLAIGRLVEGGIGCDGLIDDVRVSSGRRAIDRLPDRPHERDEFTIRLWAMDGELPGPAEAGAGGLGPGGDAGAEPDGAGAGFTPRIGPRESDADAISRHPYNADRLWDFYAQEAEHFMAASDVPAVLPPFPGLDGGGFGHWGRRNDDDWRDGSWNRMELGPVFAGVLHGLGEPVPKAVCARLGDGGRLSVCFDSVTGGIQGAWSGGFVRFDEGRFGLLGGIRPEGRVAFSAGNAAGWTVGGNTVRDAGGEGGLEFEGTYRSGSRAVFAYRLGGARVLDAPWHSDADSGPPEILRTLVFDAPLTAGLRLFPVTGGVGGLEQGQAIVSGEFGHAALRWDGDGAIEPFVGGDMVLELRLDGVRRLALALAFFDDVLEADRWLEVTDVDAGSDDPSRLTRGGDPLWPNPLVTRGERGAGDGAYVIDTLTVPHENPWNALFFLSGHDFFPDGSAAVCTINGDVWTVSGIDDDLERLEWRRFATGLHQPLGLSIVNDKVHVLGRDQVTVLHDQDGDGEADWYENYSNDFVTSAGGHDFITGLERDAAGAFYFASGNQGVCRIPPGGGMVEVVATGIRNPNGLGVSSDGTVVVSPQEGDWTPTSMVCLARPGRHFGYRGPRDGRVDPPVCFIPRGVDHSTGGHVFVDSDRFGPLGGHLLTFSWGNCRALLTLMESVDGIEQGAVVPLEGEFLSGVHRGRVNPIDGQLYVTGSSGWGTYAIQNGCFQRMRYTGRPTVLPVAFHARRNGILLRFNSPVDSSAAADPRRFFVQRWNYDYSRNYGSPEFSVAQPELPGHDRMRVLRTVPLDDGRSLFIELEDMAPVDQIHVHAKLAAAGREPGAAVGADVRINVFGTVHRLGPIFDGFPEYVVRPGLADPPEDRRRAGRAGEEGVAAGAAASTALGPSSFPKRPTDPALAGREVRIRCVSGLRYDTSEFTVVAGEKVSLTLENTDVIPHNLVIVLPGARVAVGERAARMLSEPGALDQQYVPAMDEVLHHTLVLDPGQSDTIHFLAPERPGEYPYLCTFPGHWLIMNGVMHVEQAGE